MKKRYMVYFGHDLNDVIVTDLTDMDTVIDSDDFNGIAVFILAEDELRAIAAAYLQYTGQHAIDN